MDALKYGSYMSGLYSSMAASSTTTTEPTNTSSTSVATSKSPYAKMSPKSYSDSAYETSNNEAASSTSLKGNYTADSLSRSYFDASRSYEAKSYTPDSMTTSGGRASADSPDGMKQMQTMQEQPQHNMGFNSLQVSYF